MKPTALITRTFLRRVSEKRVKCGRMQLRDAYLTAISPYPAELQPTTSLNCAPNNQLTLTQPSGYQSRWNTGSTDNNLTVGAGTYSARIMNEERKVLFPPAVVVPESVQPSAPTMSSNSGTLSLCQSSGILLSSSYNGQNIWNTANNATTITGRTITATKPGIYTLQAKNAVYGCLSDLVSNTIGLSDIDISLLLQSSRKVVALNDTVTYQLIVQNNSNCDAGSITLQNRLPPNMTVVSTGDGLSLENGDANGNKMIVGSINQIPAWQSVSYNSWSDQQLRERTLMQLK